MGNRFLRIATLLLVVLALILFFGHHDKKDQPKYSVDDGSPATANSQTVQNAAAPAEATPTTVASAEIRTLDDPENSNLSQDDFDYLTGYASRYLEAKMTGEGADEFANDLNATNNSDGVPQYNSFHALRSGAYATNADKTEATAFVVWTARENSTDKRVSYNDILRFRKVNGVWQRFDEPDQKEPAE